MNIRGVVFAAIALIPLSISSKGPLPVQGAGTVLASSQARPRPKMATFQDAHMQAEAANSEGNNLFGAKRYDEALVRYTEAIDHVENHAQRDSEAEAPLCK